jgi:hypothetical protein
LTALAVLAACNPSTPAPTPVPTNAITPAPTGFGTPTSTAVPVTPAETGHYSIDVANKGNATHKGAGHHEGDGQVICSSAAAGQWLAYGVYFPDDPVDPGKDVSDFHIGNTPGHMSASMTLRDHTTDSPFDWFLEAQSPYHPTFTFTINDGARPVTIGMVADDDSQHFSIDVTCSMVTVAP